MHLCQHPQDLQVGDMMGFICSTILCIKKPVVRKRGVTFALAAAEDCTTTKYHYPSNHLIFVFVIVTCCVQLCRQVVDREMAWDRIPFRPFGSPQGNYYYYPYYGDDHDRQPALPPPHTTTIIIILSLL